MVGQLKASTKVSSRTEFGRGRSSVVSATANKQTVQQIKTEKNRLFNFSFSVRDFRANYECLKQKQKSIIAMETR
jgi:hypothetical protein